MSIDFSLDKVTPESFKLIVISVLCALIFAAWNGLEGVQKSMSYLPVFGEQAPAPPPSAAAEKLVSLPIVQAETQTTEQQSESVSDEVIESAFKVPEPLVVKAEEPKKIALVEQLLVRYRPIVQGASDTGVFLGGKFWAIGEPILSMPVIDDAGKAILPRVTSISGSLVQLQVNDEVLNLQFDHY